MEKVFIYWDNSNIFTSAQQVAAEREAGSARYRVRLDFRNMMELACAERETQQALAVGCIPPELRHLWNRLENDGIAVQLMDQGAIQSREQAVDQMLQAAMLRDALDYSATPGIAVLLTGDGGGFADGAGFHADLERMRNRGWRIEVLSWRHSCNRWMREWAEQQGIFIALDDFYESITYLEPPAPVQPIAAARHAMPPDLSRRPVS